ncbi:MAG: hypothetical protein C7B47_08405 [Sulfobacillus thermosulfidooxidans]|uniref:Uncharacterized protein n=1 Tax=Sulfobacillus thermosulfidooxidans TaxID=28034 RepID=A0A2T2WYP7_SULTH|nr:MAG: hypothetical protein C7B47_08405 [Sulfobacillus thermosulfidooxidans]
MDRILEKAVVIATATALSLLIISNAWHTVIVPQPIPSWTIPHSGSLLGLTSSWQHGMTSLHAFFTFLRK